jgi:2-oxoglutarate/2-oxoacid ferredoxin oxidoreductase subunit beta
MNRALIWGEEIPIGKFFERTDVPALHEADPVLAGAGPLAQRDLQIAGRVVKCLIAELM